MQFLVLELSIQQLSLKQRFSNAFIVPHGTEKTG